MGVSGIRRLTLEKEKSHGNSQSVQKSHVIPIVIGHLLKRTRVANSVWTVDVPQH
jgi:hypothetical protein